MTAVQVIALVAGVPILLIALAALGLRIPPRPLPPYPERTGLRPAITSS